MDICDSIVAFATENLAGGDQESQLILNPWNVGLNVIHCYFTTDLSSTKTCFWDYFVVQWSATFILFALKTKITCFSLHSLQCSTV